MVAHQLSDLAAASDHRPSDNRRQLVIALGAMLPTLIAVVFQPRLILDDLQFARIARFEGLGGFVDEMAYRPGQGLIHGLQFVAFGENATAHLLLLAVLGAAVALAFDRLARRWLTPAMATAATVAWLILPNRGSTRFWASTVPNHLALLLLLLAAAALLPRPATGRVGTGEVRARRHLIAIAALVVAVLTYEAVALAAAAVVIAPWYRDRSRDQLVKAGASLAALGSAGLFVLVRSPRADSSGFLPAPFHGLAEAATSVGQPILGPLGWLVPLAIVLWLALDRRPELREHRRTAVAGAAVALLGIAPFLVAGFNINDLGILDRGLLFADLGLALLVAPALASLVDHSMIGRSSALAFTVALAIGVMTDLTPFSRAWDDQQAARSAFVGWQPPKGETIVLVDPPLHHGVGWAHYRIQVTDLYQLANDDDRQPDWLDFRLDSARVTAGQTPVVIVDSTVVALAVE